MMAGVELYCDVFHYTVQEPYGMNLPIMMMLLPFISTVLIA